MTTIAKRRLPLWTISTFVLLLAMGTAGCAKKNDPSVATASPSSGTGVTAPAGGGQASALKYSQCMRDQGLSWFPDPDAQGNLKVSAPDGTDQSKVDKANEACKKYLPSGGGAGQISAEDLNKIRQVAQCVRDHGFPKYPDPDANGSIAIDSQTTGIQPDDPNFQKAQQECQKYMPPKKGSSS
jgi:hypothetical protein